MIARKQIVQIDDLRSACRSPEATQRSRKELQFDTRPLSIEDAASCYALELATFAPTERASLEKYQYRLRQSSELSLGIFIAAGRGNEEYWELVGQVSATRTADHAVTNDAVDVPKDNDAPCSRTGHIPTGRTVCLHTLAISPKCQRTGLGRKLMTAYLERLKDCPTVDRVALIARTHLVPYYESFGFESHGPSRCTRYGDGWFDMVLVFAR